MAPNRSRNEGSLIPGNEINRRAKDLAKDVGDVSGQAPDRTASIFDVVAPHDDGKSGPVRILWRTFNKHVVPIQSRSRNELDFANLSQLMRRLAHFRLPRSAVMNKCTISIARFHKRALRLIEVFDVAGKCGEACRLMSAKS